MKVLKTFALFLILITTLLGACGCMFNQQSSPIRKESDQEYTLLMKNYVEKKYNISVTVVETIFPKEGFNTGMLENVVVAQNQEGVLINVKARLSTPYEYYDNYVEACTAAKMEDGLQLHLSVGTGKFYVATNQADPNNINPSPENIGLATYVAFVPCQPNEQLLEELYTVYTKIHENGYTQTTMEFAFTQQEEEFQKAAENFMIYGKSNWSDYTGTIYATGSVTETNLTFEQFKNKVEYK